MAVSSQPGRGDFKVDRMARSALDRLTRRQREVAELIRRGMSNREIGAALSISDQTVASHLTRIYRRSGYHDREALAARLNRERARAKVLAAAAEVDAVSEWI